MEWSPIEARFDRGLAALAAYLAREGHADVPLDHREGGFALGPWVNNCRASQRRGSLAAAHRAAIERVAPGFRWDPGRDHCRRVRRVPGFERNLRAVVAFAAREGHTRLPQKTERRLALWVRRQRYLRRHGELPAERVGAIDRALPGFDWSPTSWSPQRVTLETPAERVPVTGS
jgi:hypothetical protein